MRYTRSCCIALLSTLSGCANTPDADLVDVGEPSPAAATNDFRAAAFGSPWDLTTGWLPAQSSGAAYIPGQAQHVIHHDPVDMAPPLIALARYTPDYQAWQRYCAGEMAPDDALVPLLLSSTIPTMLGDTCFVTP